MAECTNYAVVELVLTFLHEFATSFYILARVTQVKCATMCKFYTTWTTISFNGAQAGDVLREWVLAFEIYTWVSVVHTMACCCWRVTCVYRVLKYISEISRSSKIDIHQNVLVDPLRRMLGKSPAINVQ